jgi:Concanavalin A-like lectin/glucanases superfamily
MKIKHTLILMILQTLISSQILFAETLILGVEDDWNGTVLNNLKTTAGKGGFLDLVLNRSELNPGKDSTDILLSFNEAKGRDQSGNYTILEQPEFSRKYFKSGAGSATFDRENSMRLEADTDEALFSPFTNWEDFTIEFWLYPANPREGENIIEWNGLGRDGDEIYSQSILCHFINRRLVWSFSNIFQMPDSPESFYEISGDPVLPRQWNHHMLRYDSLTGMLEYLVNGQPSAIIYTTDDGHESSTVYTPRVGEEPGELIIGSGFTGFMDEFRMERRFVDKRSTRRYEQPGYGISPVLDLKFSDSRLNSLKAVENSPGNAAVFPYYFTTNSLLEAEERRKAFLGESTVLDSPELWKPFSEIDINSRGRYLILTFLLYPDMKEDLTPGLSFLELDYTPSLPPLPPAYIHAQRSDNGQLRLEWNPSASPEVEGYLLFFGENPGEYIYPGSPLKIEKENYTLIDGLSPFKQYFFAIKSFTGSDNPRYSDFSEEISIRP